MTYLTSVQVAKRARVNYNTLLYWLRTGKVRVDKRRNPGKHWVPIRWTERECQRVERLAEARRVLLAAGWGGGWSNTWT